MKVHLGLWVILVFATCTSMFSSLTSSHRDAMHYSTKHRLVAIKLSVLVHKTRFFFRTNLCSFLKEHHGSLLLWVTPNKTNPQDKHEQRQTMDKWRCWAIMLISLNLLIPSTYFSLKWVDMKTFCSVCKLFGSVQTAKIFCDSLADAKHCLTQR